MPKHLINNVMSEQFYKQCYEKGTSHVMSRKLDML
jgi:hypothetical protein